MGKRNKKAFLIGSVGVVIIGVIGGAIWYRSNEQLNEMMGRIKGNTVLNGTDISFLRYTQIQANLEASFRKLEQLSIRLTIGDRTYIRTLSDFDFQSTMTPEELTRKMEEEQWPSSYWEQLFSLYEDVSYDYHLNFTWDEQKVVEWVGSIAKELNEPLILPELQLEGQGFVLTEGQDAYELDQVTLIEEINELLASVSEGEERLEVSTELVQVETRGHLYEQLKTVNHKISTFNSYYPMAEVDRAANVELATSKLNGAVILPGEVFSFTDRVAPITTEAGYRPATVFINGTYATDIGGGVCQVSSTLYNTQLYAGILPTERRNHSLRVYYVPIGQDATMYEGSIDYKFQNTLDYPIYIEAIAIDGVLEISFWSNEQALNGIRYEPKTSVSSDGLRADTTLYGYDEEGNLIYEKFLHTSQYKG